MKESTITLRADTMSFSMSVSASSYEEPQTSDGTTSRRAQMDIGFIENSNASSSHRNIEVTYVLIQLLFISSLEDFVQI